MQIFKRLQVHMVFFGLEKEHPTGRSRSKAVWSKVLVLPSNKLMEKLQEYIGNNEITHYTTAQRLCRLTKNFLYLFLNVSPVPRLGSIYRKN